MTQNALKKQFTNDLKNDIIMQVERKLYENMTQAICDGLKNHLLQGADKTVNMVKNVNDY